MLTTLLKLKVRIKIDAFDVKDDATLNGFLSLVSGRFEKFCNRKFARDAAATCVFRGDELDLRVDRYPIESVTSFHLKTNETEGWVAEVSDYLISGSRAIVTLPASLGTQEQLLRVTFAGGFVLPDSTPSAGQTALPDEIEQSCIEQAAYLWQRKNELGLTSVSADNSSIQQFAAMDLLPGVKEVLKKFERMMA